jgi:hypothetical protein
MALIEAIANQGRAIREYALADDADYVEGAVLTLNDGEIEEAGTNPEAILGFAVEPAELTHDFNPGRRLVLVAQSNSTFFMQARDAGELVEPDAEEEGNEYGITADASGVWFVDLEKTGATARVVIERADPVRKMFEIRILDDFRILN